MSERTLVARELARRHFAVDPGMSRIFTIIDGSVNEELPDAPIKLLEVNDSTVPYGVMPLYFGPAPSTGITFPSVIVEVTPEEFEKIEKRELSLPAGWSIGPELMREEL
jgi:hypothetical protein